MASYIRLLRMKNNKSIYFVIKISIEENYLDSFFAKVTMGKALILLILFAAISLSQATSRANSLEHDVDDGDESLTPSARKRVFTIHSLKAERFHLRKAYELQRKIDEESRKLLKAKELFLRNKGNETHEKAQPSEKGSPLLKNKHFNAFSLFY